MESEEMRNILREEFNRFKSDVIEPIREDTHSNTKEISRLRDCATGIKQEVAALKANSAWHTWGLRVLYGSAITEGIAIITLLIG